MSHVQPSLPAPLPVLFVAHGAPLLAIQDERAAPIVAWGRRLARPRAVLVLSAHWEAPLSLGATTHHDTLVYDFGRGLPASLFTIQWPAPGAPALAARVGELLADPEIRHTDRGLDHGAWTELMRLFPDADVPTLQLSVPRHASEREPIALDRRVRRLDRRPRRGVRPGRPGRLAPARPTRRPGAPHARAPAPAVRVPRGRGRRRRVLAAHRLRARLHQPPIPADRRPHYPLNPTPQVPRSSHVQGPRDRRPRRQARS